MALLTESILNNLNCLSFSGDFTRNADAYLGCAGRIAARMIAVLTQQGNPYSLSTAQEKETFAETHLIASLAATFLSDQFPYFRQALAPYIYMDFDERLIWARLMARYVLHEAIQRGGLG
jgi:hypothetical protein